MIDLEINTKNLDVAIRYAPKILKEELGDGMDHISRKFLKIFREARLQGPPGIKARSHGIFTYFKRASLVPTGGALDMGMVIFSTSKISRMHEEGAILRNPSGGKLAVPLSQKFRPEMYTVTGKLKAMYKSPRQIKNVVPIKLNGKIFLAKVKKKIQALLPLYVLKNQVKIRPRLGFYQTWDSMQGERFKILNDSVKKALARI